jgi:hypothetical protein
MQGLILDLRWNPGGLLEQAVDVCSKFLPGGQLVVTTEGRIIGMALMVAGVGMFGGLSGLVASLVSEMSKLLLYPEMYGPSRQAKRGRC